MTYLSVIAMLLSQVPVTATVSYHTAACNAAKLSGFVPFKATFTCNTQPGSTGCVATGTMSFDYWNGAEYPRFCEIQQFGQLPPLLNVDTVLSGLELSTEGPVDHNDVSVDFSRTSFNASNYTVDWSVTVLWANQPGIGVDKFTATVHGMFVFTAQNEIVLGQKSFGCKSPGEFCSDTRSLAQGTKSWGGLAFNRVLLRAPSGTVGPGSPPPLYPGPTFLTAELTEVPTSSGQDVTFTCGVGSAVEVDCKARAVVILGEKGFVEPFQHENNPAFQSTSNTAVAFMASTGPKAAMNCGVRRFYVQGDSSPLVNRRYQSFWFGQNATDCGWTPGDKYTGLFLFGWENPYSAAPFYLQVNRADGTRLP